MTDLIVNADVPSSVMRAAGRRHTKHVEPKRLWSNVRTAYAIAALLSAYVPGSGSLANPIEQTQSAEKATSVEAGIATLLSSANAARQRGHFDDAVKRFEEALTLQEQMAPESAPVSETLNLLGLSYDAVGRTADAERVWKRALTIRSALPLDDYITAATARNLAMLYNGQNRLKEARPLFERALVIRRRVLPPDHPDIVESLTNLGIVSRSLGHPKAAIPLFSEAAAIAERRGFDKDLATALNRVGLANDDAGYSNEAEASWRRALGIREKVLTPKDPDIAVVARNLGILLRNQGRFDEAEPLLIRALAIRREAQPPDLEDVATSLVDLAAVHRLRGQFDAASRFCEEAVDTLQSAFGSHSSGLASAFECIGVIRVWQGLYSDAEREMKRALSIRENTLGQDHDMTGKTLMQLGTVSLWQNKEKEAEQFFRRAISILERSAPSSPGLAEVLSNFAGMLRDQGKYEEADGLFRRALSIQEKSGSFYQVELANTLNGFAASFVRQGRPKEAEPLMTRVLDIRERLYGSNHPAVASTLVDFARMSQYGGKFDQAEMYAKRALAISDRPGNANPQSRSFILRILAAVYAQTNQDAQSEQLSREVLKLLVQTLGPDSARVALAWDDVSYICAKREKLEEALSARREARRIRDLLTEREGDQAANSVEGGYARTSLFMLMKLLNPPRLDHDAVDEAFQAAQRAGGLETAQALAQMAARGASGSDELASLLRRQQDQKERWRALDAAYVKAMSQGGDAAERVRQEIADLDLALRRDDVLLKQRFPRFAELSRPRPSSVADVQAVLGEDEAIVLWSVKADGYADDAFSFIVRKDRAGFFRIALKPSEIASHVASLRNGLDRRGRDLIDMPAFDAGKAHLLYRALFGPGEHFLSGVNKLLIVPDGALQSIPPGILLIDPPTKLMSENLDYSAGMWLTKRYAITILPAVSSFISLRTLPLTGTAAQPFAGFGDPDLGTPGKLEHIVSLAPESLFRGGTANVENLLKLPPLPETADELRAEADMLGADPSSVHLRQNATVTAVKTTDLSDARVLAFATHGLIAGELPKLAEPALVLTPPSTPNAADDGLLRASEVSQLKLNADWVILSACNTASPSGTPGAEGLSGLAKSFFYAGARALLVSHWPVDSGAAIKLTTGAFRALKDEPAIGRAEAFRRSMVAMINGPDPSYAHPLFWAPFVVVGEGGSKR